MSLMFSNFLNFFLVKGPKKIIILIGVLFILTWIGLSFIYPFSFFYKGFISMSMTGLILFYILSAHFSMVSTSLFLHRNQTHLAVNFNPVVSFLMRFHLWLTTGINTKEWVAIHRKHHRHTDRINDPHSPKYKGIGNMLRYGYDIYNEAKTPEVLDKYGVGTVDDWLERYFFSPYAKLGPLIYLILLTFAFGLYGIIFWNLQMIYQIFFQASVINGLGHYIGYRNFNTNDNSRNILPIGILVGGEELHNNHHHNPGSAKFSFKLWEFDIGWLYIKCLILLRLAKLNCRQKNDKKENESVLV
ncbi:hypothetical protein E3983_12030 [Legionella israelensis]|uniref:Fatty acid desaturase domain-containing protein n=2 Tax=Legionella israelensis TaxID=454 RepID=A0AAX1EJP0_9GAMM|nr:hypothetical protein E3983_12030 [Legionella israelensis]